LSNPAQCIFHLVKEVKRVQLAAGIVMNTNFFRTKIWIAESDVSLRSAYTCIINGRDRMIVIGSSATLSANGEELKGKRPDLIIFGAQDDEDANRLRVFASKFVNCKILVYSSNKDRDFVFTILRAGVSGFITKDSDFHEVIAGIEEIIGGGVALSSPIARMIVESYHLNANSPLTKREAQILNLLAKGKTYTQISEILDIAKDTSKKHIYNIYHKLNARSKAEAIRIAKTLKLIVRTYDSGVSGLGI
jgi:DNA-binding NarL/FixJ family response regulator